MSITKNYEISGFKVNYKDKYLLVFYDLVIKENGEEIARKPKKYPFVPGDINKIKNLTGLGDNNVWIKAFDSMWDAQTISDYKAKIAAQE